MADYVGQQFGNYLLTQMLGHGGFADVYLGEHRLLKTQAAIKVMHDPLNEPEFLEEARTIAALTHPNIVRVLEFDVKELSTYHRVSFLVMDYAPQGTLCNHHPRGTIVPLGTMLTYIQQVADALQYAHDHRVIHRDVKLENMLIGARGQILLSDFGIAAIAHSTTSLKTINVSGTPSYMAPEQWDGKPCPASDQYSLGIIAYELLSGCPPFLGDMSALFTQHHYADPPPFPPTLHIPIEIEKVINRALDKDPKQRFVDVKTFAQELQQAQQISSSTNAPLLEPIMPPLPRRPAPQPTQPVTPQPHTSLDTIYREGVKAQAQGDPERAVSLWQQVLTTDPNYGNGRLAIQVRDLQSDTRYKEGLKAQAQGDLERADSLWQQVLTTHPNYDEGKLAIQVRELQRKLVSIRIPRLRQQAKNAHSQGNWQQEIAVWKDLLTLQPYDSQTQERLSIATNNEQYAWMYENAKQFITEGDLAAAQQQLTTLWKNAPYYGDPMHIATSIPSITVPPNYEIQQEAIRRQKAKLQARTSLIFGAPLLFCTIGGLGASVGLFTQSWTWASATAFLIALLTPFMGYHKLLPWFVFVIVGTLGIASALGIAVFASFHIDYTLRFFFVYFAGDNSFIYIGRQAIAGTISGLITGGLLAWSWTNVVNLLWLTLSLLSLCSLIWLTSYVGSGFGFGPGWPILLLGMVVGLLGGAGASGSLYIWYNHLSSKHRTIE